MSFSVTLNSVQFKPCVPSSSSIENSLYSQCFSQLSSSLSESTLSVLFKMSDSVVFVSIGTHISVQFEQFNFLIIYVIGCGFKGSCMLIFKSKDSNSLCKSDILIERLTFPSIISAVSFVK